MLTAEMTLIPASRICITSCHRLGFSLPSMSVSYTHLDVYKRQIMLSENPNASITPNVPISEIGTAMVGMSVARQFCSERQTTRITSSRASNLSLIHI